MARLVQADIIARSSFTNSKDGINVVRTFLVGDLSSDPWNRQYEAMNLQGIPRYGDSHPSIPRIVVQNIQIEAQDQNNAYVYVAYKAVTNSSSITGAKNPVTVGSSVTQVLTNRDKDGRIMQVSGYSSPYTPGNTPKCQAIDASIMIPQAVASFTQKENASPLDKSVSYCGTVNLTAFLGKSARTWLCTRISGQSDDGGRTFVVYYEFQYKPNTWDYESVMTGTDGKPLPFLTLNQSKNGFGIALQDPNRVLTENKDAQAWPVRKYRVYQESDFTQLGIKSDASGGGSTGFGIGGGVDGLQFFK